MPIDALTGMDVDAVASVDPEILGTLIRRFDYPAIALPHRSVGMTAVFSSSSATPPEECSH
jgi:hypothetical protein